MALVQTNLYPFLLCAVLVYGETLTLFAGRISPNAFFVCKKFIFHGYNFGANKSNFKAPSGRELAP